MQLRQPAVLEILEKSLDYTSSDQFVHMTVKSVVCGILRFHLFKRSVQRDVRGVESRAEKIRVDTVTDKLYNRK
jgi:hypothetical protein